MATIQQKITPNLWFDSEAEEAAKFYTSVFGNARMGRISRYKMEDKEIAERTTENVLTVEFELEGMHFVALNGGPMFKFSEAVSFIVNCEDQAEVDYFWEKLSEGGEKSRCGWLKDQYGLSWQVVPTIVAQLMTGDDPAGVKRAMEALLKMDKLDIDSLQRAYDGSGQ